MRRISACIALASLASAAEVFFSPPLRMSTASAELALAHHFGLEYFEPLPETGEIYVEFASEQLSTGGQPSSGLLVAVHEAVAKGASPIVGRVPATNNHSSRRRVAVFLIL